MDNEANQTAGGGKRRSGPRNIPIVERLYRENQESYTGSGGFHAGDDEYEERRERINEAKQRRRDLPFANQSVPEECNSCEGTLQPSTLWERFSHPVCNSCRDHEGAHKLIPRTEAKSTYLLKDCDLDLRKPPLRYIAKKNPHNPRYGDMKLYLRTQLESRALEVHGSWERLEEAKQHREDTRGARIEKRFERNIKRMRKELHAGAELDANTLAALGSAGSGVRHTHRYEGAAEEYDEETRRYSKKCSICGQQNFYEKL